MCPRLQGGEPSQIYVGVHSFGAWYTWDPTNRHTNIHLYVPKFSMHFFIIAIFKHAVAILLQLYSTRTADITL